MNRLDTVSSFRAEVLRNVAVGIYKGGEAVDQQQQQAEKRSQVSRVKGQETFPEPFEKEKAALQERRKGQLRSCKVSPNIAANHELYDIPEAAGNQSQQRKSPDHRKQQSVSGVSGEGSVDSLCETEEASSHGNWMGEMGLPEEQWTVDAVTFGRGQGNKAETEDDLCK